MELIKDLNKYLPNYEDIECLVQNEPESAYILKLSIEALQLMDKEELQANRTEEAAYLIEALVDKCWERIHTGHFSEVPLHIRKIYALGSYLKIFFLLFESNAGTQIERCNEILDEAMLIGCTQDLYKDSDVLKEQLVQYFEKQLELLKNDANESELLPTLPVLQRQKYKCDIQQMDCPALELFKNKCFVAEQPALLFNTIKHWPAVHKWRDLNYLLKVAGNRTVPIEIGSNYTTDEWSQQLLKIRDFLKRQFGTKNANIEYLAQHELFEQIKALKEDIRVPDYCSLGNEPDNVDIKAWLGPAGTISPLHYDPKHNLLCQVFGAKKIILAAPRDTPKLYPHESEFLSNTSQLDAAHIDVEKFPLASEAKFYELTLQEGDCLYMPPKWWHYVRAETPSFSVSFWWQ